MKWRQAWRSIGWAEGVGLATALAAVLAIAAFYAARLAVPLPLFAADEGAYLIRALYPDDVVARNPWVADVSNGAHLSVLRAAYRTGGPFILIDRLVNAAAYFGGIAALWNAWTRTLPTGKRLALLLLALGFAYERFAVSTLPEGLYVGLLALICLVTQRWYRARPLVHAAVTGLLCASLVLTKPHGLAVVAALGATAALDSVVSRDARRLPLRLMLFAAVFFGAGNLIQLGAEAAPANPWTFFLSRVYAGALRASPGSDAWRITAPAVQAMTGAVAVLAGPPLLAGASDLVGRWRRERGELRLDGEDLAFLLVAIALAATLAMATIYALRIADIASETRRLWGRYFEFFVPLLWLAAAPALSRQPGRGLALAHGAVVLGGLAALLGALERGVVVFPWDSSVLTAFFAPDPERAPFASPVPYRALATGAGLLAATALALRAPPIRTGLALILSLSLLSTWQDHEWLAPMARARVALARDDAAMRPRLPPEPAAVSLLAPDENDGHLGFLAFGARPTVTVGPPTRAPGAAVAAADVAVVAGPDTPPGGPWSRVYQGDELSLWRRDPAVQP